ncbi:Hypothetical predicted protein, partial [Pelobates cultripes]
ALPWLVALKHSTEIPQHPTLSDTMKVCKKVAHYPNVTPSLSPKYPITHNLDFPMGGQEWQFSTTKQQLNATYLPISHLYHNSTLGSFNTLAATDTPTHLQKFRYYQLKHFLKMIPIPNAGPRSETHIE